MAYVDGFLVPVPKDNKEAYRTMAEAAAAVFQKYGALRVVECWGDDVPDGKSTDFKRAVKLEEGEQVVFSWIVWPNKDARDEGMAKAMKDPIFESMKDMPFDGKRMIFGGFDVLVDIGRD
jgi:uncharacterized protein YbaA (DUF1428 family)